MATLKYTVTHEWLKPDGEEYAMGITEHAQQLLGDMVFVELPSIGKNMFQGEEIGVVESVKAASDFYAPIAGQVTAINQAVIDNPGLVNQDPYGEGWLVKIKPANAGDIENLLNSDAYERAINEESM